MSMPFFHGSESYRPAELFDETGKLVPEIAEIAPKGDRRMAMNPITNAGVIKPMNTADWKKHALQFNTPGEINGSRHDRIW